MTAKPKLKGNQCTHCEKTHEKCAGAQTCPKSHVSLHVCRVFGVRPQR